MKKQKDEKCEECNAPIPEGSEAYRNGKLICQRCWYGRHNSSDTVEEYLRKLRS